MDCANIKASGREQEYLLGRSRDSLGMARQAGDSSAKLIHFDLAGRYSVAAARAAARRTSCLQGLVADSARQPAELAAS